MSPLLLKAKELLLDILFPPICATCNKNLYAEEKENSICTECFNLIPVLRTLTCPVCRARMAQNIKTCHKNIPYRLFAASTYENKLVKNMIWKLKYEKKTYIAKTLSKV